MKEKNMFLSQICKIINAGPPVANAPAVMDGVYVNMKNFAHLTAIIQTGVGAPATVTVEEDADGSGAGTAIGFNYRLCDVGYNATGGDILGNVTAIGVGGIALGGTDNSFLVVEVDAANPDKPYMRVRLSSVTAYESMIYILSGARYQDPNTVTALTV
jgi:hypothetical protein